MEYRAHLLVLYCDALEYVNHLEDNRKKMVKFVLCDIMIQLLMPYGVHKGYVAICHAAFCEFKFNPCKTLCVVIVICEKGLIIYLSSITPSVSYKNKGPVLHRYHSKYKQNVMANNSYMWILTLPKSGMLSFVHLLIDT